VLWSDCESTKTPEEQQATLRYGMGIIKICGQHVKIILKK
jgi:hypothetical protein